MIFQKLFGRKYFGNSVLDFIKSYSVNQTALIIKINNIFDTAGIYLILFVF